jgi:hypothetical protein
MREKCRSWNGRGGLVGKPEEEEETESTCTEIELQEYNQCFHLPDIRKKMGLDTINDLQHLVSIEK